jgi:hypothetical protein
MHLLRDDSLRHVRSRQPTGVSVGGAESVRRFDRWAGSHDLSQLRAVHDLGFGGQWMSRRRKASMAAVRAHRPTAARTA